MLGKDQDHSSVSQEEYKAFYNALISLSRDLEKLNKDLKAQIDNLKREYPEEALISLSRYFEKISSKFSKYLIATQSKHYETLHRSNKRIQAAKKIEQTSEQIALKFEQFSRRPKSYSQVMSRLKIEKLISQIENLQIYCKVKKA
jgi:hypothetical protein